MKQLKTLKMYPVLEKVHSIISKTLSNLSYKYVYVVLGMVFWILVKEHLIYVIILVPYIVFLFILHKKVLMILIVFVMFYQLRVTLFHVVTIKENDTYLVSVQSDIKHTYRTSFIGTVKGQKVQVMLPDLQSIKPGDVLTIEGELEIPRNNTIPNGFSYRDYLYAKGIKSIIKSSEVKKSDHRLSIYAIPYNINKYIENNTPKTKEYIKTFILADKSGFDREFINDLNHLGISHLFAVSGLHIGLFVLVFEFLIRHKKKTIIISFILVIYMFITAFSPSVVRASLLYIMIKYKTHTHLKLSNLDVLSIIFIGYIFVSPYIYKNIGFQLSFIVTFTILLTPFLLKNKSMIQSLYIITIVSFFSTLPIIVSLNYQINLYSLFINTIMILYMSYIILPFGYVTFLLPFLDTFYSYVIKPFEFLIEMQSKIEVITIRFTFTNSLLVILYYVVLILVFITIQSSKRMKYIQLMFLVLFVVMFSNRLSPIKQISVIDIYGDSILIKDHFDQCNIVVDTGVNDAYDSVVNYIKNKNIRRIDYLIITHYHDDHMGELEDIKKEFDVINYIDYHTNIEQLTCGSFHLMFFPEIQEFDENNRSVVFQLQIEGDTYLFTGDIEREREGELIEEYIIESNYLKAGHHGSITSSTETFIDSVNPHTALITSFYKNTHNHPSSIVIQRFETRGIEVFRIDEDGTIIIEYLFGFTFKKTTPPD